VFKRLGLPESSVTFLIVLSALGLLVACAAAWFYKPPSGAATGAHTIATLATAAVLLVVSIVAISYVVAQRLDSDDRPPERSVAVLPFDNMSGDPRNNYLGDGLADEIASKLTRVPGLEVASRTSAFAFRGSDADAQKIGAALGVRHILEGSIRRDDNRLRVTAQLIDTATGYHLWSKTFDRARTDLLDIEEDISGSVLEALRIVLSPEALQSLTEDVTEDSDAYDAYLQGIAALRQSGGIAAIETSIQHFKQALAIDPTFAEAYAGLCQADVKRYTFLHAPDLVASAESSCAQARRLDSELPDVHLALGMLH
jgi:TolB-like protein